MTALEVDQILRDDVMARGIGLSAEAVENLLIFFVASLDGHRGTDIRALLESYLEENPYWYVMRID